MQISHIIYPLQFKFPFHIAHGIRSHTDCIFLKISSDSYAGYGEITLPPYLPETIASCLDFLKKIQFEKYSGDNIDPTAISASIHEQWDGFYPVKAAINNALWDLKGKMEVKSVRDYLTNDTNSPECTYTIGISSRSDMLEKIYHATNFNLIKLKLDGIQDVEIIQTFIKYSDKTFAVDANQSWNDIDYAKKMIDLLSKTKCILIEQPFEKSDRKLSALLKQFSSLPIIADEAFQNIEDIDSIATSFDGINLKLLKCGGISNATQIITSAKQHQLKILIGCMSESACGCAAASMLQQSADWVDLDGPYLIHNNPFEGYEIRAGKILIENNIGLGIHTNLF
ncbi:MAG: enolase C-terminal domain-like protein [Bacteroidota bacterium]